MADLGSVIVGGLIASVSAVGSQWFFYSLKAREERKARQASKFEDLVLALQQFEHWLTIKQEYRVIGIGDGNAGPSPFAQVRAIVAVHFPQFVSDVFNLRHKSLLYERKMLDAAQARFASGQSHLEIITEAQHEFQGALFNFQQKLETFSVEYFSTDKRRKA